jgi:hypothetical protein
MNTRREFIAEGVHAIMDQETWNTLALCSLGYGVEVGIRSRVALATFVGLKAIKRSQFGVVEQRG